MTNSAAQIATSDYAETTKALLELVQQLTSIGAQSVLEIPRVVVIGNQSAGMHPRLQITVPRDSGTCTRCSMECRMARSAPATPWSCRVSIRWEYDADDRRRAQVTQVPFGDVLYERDAVELALRRAQFAVLHANAVDAPCVLDMSRDALRKGIKGTRSLPFSRNVVCVDLEGPEMTDLAFIDLPGLIQNEEDRLVKLVETLVVEHIQGNSLILVTVPMTDDLENQKALTLAREADPDGKRTIGVLTKPDVVSKGSRARALWLEVIEGRKRPLLHGYYCTRQPDDDERERGIDAAGARKAEMAYFETTAPWNKSSARSQFGINNLASTLSPLLAQIIRDTLPTLRQHTEEHLASCTEDLSKLPEPVKDHPTEHMRNLIGSLYEQFDGFAKGSQGSERLIQTSRTIFAQFKRDIRATAPEYVPFLKTDPRSAADWTAARGNLQDSEDEGVHEHATSTGRRLRKPIYLDEVRSRIAGSITRELPNNVPFPAKVALIIDFRSNWPMLAKRCFDAVREVALSILLERVHALFGRWDFLHVQLQAYVTSLIKEHYVKCQAFIDGVLLLDYSPYTQNDHYFQSTREKWLSKYRSMRSAKTSASVAPEEVPSSPKPNQNGSSRKGGQKTGGQKTGAFGQWTQPPPAADEPINMDKLLGDLATAGYPGLSVADLERLVKPDEYDTEMQVMAEVRSYFQVAYKRIIDLVPAFIDSIFIQGIPTNMRPFLREQLKLGVPGADERCERFMAEDPSLIARRESLLARKTTLEGVKDALDGFGFRTVSPAE
ncbi:hypothetical protein FA95DRAFT_1504134 [Auriscalpium vulgare]|uniref:Uncharacterized protein n=1 Tax=Auriscalpium vulgare TaxID=40419 RepID=A0ACB8R632_9AGAM|nr:hypothetical protein FA95DRAFT_1504134 [Auriscalpium vulgare]